MPPKVLTVPDLPINEFRFSYSRSSGPGGQNVNKVNSKVTLKWAFYDSNFLNSDQKKRFESKYINYCDFAKNLIITSDVTREKLRNQEDCILRLKKFIKSIWTPPKPRIPTKTSYSSKLKRVNDKKMRADVKVSRRKNFE